MNTRRIAENLAGLALSCLFFQAAATPVPLDTNNPQNGITEIYSATFDGALSNCTMPGAPSYCAFFGGFPPLSPPSVRNLNITPNPTRVINGVPLGITPIPARGSFLDLTLDPGHQQLTLNGGVVRFPDPIHIIISTAGVENTFINAVGAGIVFLLPPAVPPAPAPTSIATTSVDANGVAEFLVDLAPATAVDFSLFSVVAIEIGNCTGTFCGLIPVLTLDMIKYRLVIDYDPTFTTFTASFIGKTANNSMLTGNLVSKLPSSVVVTDSISPDADLAVPFGNVPEGLMVSATVTVANDGLADLAVGQIDATQPPLDPAFAVVNDNCSNQSVPPGDSCTFGIDFQPSGIAPFSDSLDIPSDDFDNPVVTIAVNGTGISSVVPDIIVTDSSSPFDDRLVAFRSVLVSDTANQTITVTNDGPGDLVVGTVGQLNTLDAPFAIVADGCSGMSIAPNDSCEITLSFTPGAVQAYSSGLDIPSNDPDEASVTVGVSGDGGAPAIEPAPDGAESGFMAVDPLILLGLGVMGIAARRRR